MILLVSAVFLIVPENLSMNLWKISRANFSTSDQFDDSIYSMYDLQDNFTIIDGNISRSVNESTVELCPLIPKNLSIHHEIHLN